MNNEWISVKDRLPKGECIAFGYQKEMLIGYISYNEETETYEAADDVQFLTNVTHWMQPEAPKE